jgi:hypothetical protein
MTKQMDMEFINTLMGPSTRDSGRMTCNMGMVWKLGLMDLGMKETIHKEERMVLVLTSGTMDLSILVIGLRIKSAV